MSSVARERAWTVLELLRASTEHFAKAGIATARLDAEVLLAGVGRHVDRLLEERRAALLRGGQRDHRHQRRQGRETEGAVEHPSPGAVGIGTRRMGLGAVRRVDRDVEGFRKLLVVEVDAFGPLPRLVLADLL